MHEHQHDCEHAWWEAPLYYGAIAFWLAAAAFALGLIAGAFRCGLELAGWT